MLLTGKTFIYQFNFLFHWNAIECCTAVCMFLVCEMTLVVFYSVVMEIEGQLIEMKVQYLVLMYSLFVFCQMYYAFR